VPIEHGAGEEPAEAAAPAAVPAIPALIVPGEREAAPPARPATLRVPSQQLRQDRQLLSLLRDAVNATQDEQGWARVGAVGTQIGNKASFDARNYGYASLTKLLAATQAFEMRDEGTSRGAVRDKRQARVL
jgi:hypothetical protein